MKEEIRQRIEQIRRGEVPQGYKRETKKIIPNDWYDYKLGDIGQVLMCKRIYANETNEFGEIPFYKIGTFGKKADAFISRSLYEDYKAKYSYPQTGDILISAAGTLGRTVVYDGQEAYFQDSNIVWLKINQRILSNEYLMHYYQIIEWPTPEGATIQRLYNGIIQEAHITAPLLAEQQKIAAILTAQDKVIELKEKRLAEKQRQKKHLMQQLLTGQKRLPGFSGEWSFPKAKEIFQSISDKKHNGDLVVLSSMQDRGIVPREQVDIDIKYDRSSLVTYKKVCQGNFVISLRSFQGGIEYSAYTGLVSPAYTVLAAQKEISDEYYKQFFKSADYINRLNVAVYGIRDGKQISYEDFGRLRIPYPPIEEQKAIAEVLSAADREIDLLRQDIEQEKQKKKALMQLLLTGIVRVKG